MSEHLPHTAPVHESLPSTPEVDPETVAEIDSIEDSVDTRVTSKWAERLQRTADRVGAFLEDRAINKAHKEALKEDHGRTVEAQNEAYESYTENIAVTQNRETEERRAERREKAKGFFNKIGNSSLNFLVSQGFIPLRGKWHEQGKGKLNMNFSAWVARKYEAAKKRRGERAAGFLSAEQNEAVTGDTETEPTADASPESAPEAPTPDSKEEPTPDKPAETETTADKKSESPDTETTTDSPEEGESTHDSEERARAAREKAAERAAAAAERREKRRERVKNVTERAKTLFKKLKLSRIGSSALVGRARASLNAAKTAWSDFGKE